MITQKELNKARDKAILEDEEVKKFYRPYFDNNDKRVTKFIKKCLKRDRTRKILLITQWFIEIADKMKEVHKGTSNFQILFLFILAESVAKYYEDYKKEDKSKDFVKTFFTFLSLKDKRTIIHKFKKVTTKRSTITCFINTLYAIRSKLVHNGIFFDFFFKGASEDYTTVERVLRGGKNKKRTVAIECDLQYEEFKNIIIKTSIRMMEKANSV